MAVMMRAGVIQDKFKIGVEEVAKPSAGPGEALIRVAYTGICGSDTHLFQWRHPLSRKGLIPGHEFSGIVEEINDEESGIRAGDKVCAHINQSCGKCTPCKKGLFNLCRNLKVLGSQIDGTFAEYVVVPVSKLFKLPDDADLKLAALAEPFAVGVYATDRAHFEVADTALVIGAGPIGLCCAIAAKKAGASRVVLSEVSKERISFARNMGFEVVDSGEEPLTDIVNRLTDGEGFNRIYETSGVAPSTGVVTEICAPHARIIFVAYTKDPRPINTWELMRKEAEITSMRVHTQPAYEAAVQMILSDPELAAQLSALVTGEYSLDDIQTAFDESQNAAKNCKIMVKIAE